MRIAYYDEAGDDGVPGSSPLFVLGAMYMHYLHWQGNFKRIQDFRSHLKQRYGFPIKLEVHSKELLLNKNPYRPYGISDDDRVAIIGECCDLIASLDVRIVNVAIIKSRIQSADYPVLDKALTYSVQRIENDLNVDMDQVFAAGTVDRFHLLFPDPWFKQRHRKRRVIEPWLLRVLRRQLRPGGELHFASDIYDVALAAMAEVEDPSNEALGFRNLAGPWSFWRGNPFDAASRRERITLRRGQRVWRMRYVIP